MEINFTRLFGGVGRGWQSLTRKARILWIRFSRGRRRSSYVGVGQQEMVKAQRMRLLARVAVGAVGVGIVGFFILFAWYSRDLPKPGEVIRREGFSTKIYDRDGALLYDLYDDERRTPVTLDELPAYLKQAVVAIEDRDFYRHSGFDILTAIRIPYNILFRQRVVGGSTLTQQLVKNALLTNERTLSRKFKEFVLSIQIERTFTKDQILEMYLNEAPYGGTAWGVGTAVEVYFNKPVADLTLLESAFLAGLPQRPSIYSPFSGRQDENGVPFWQIRTESVLRAMERSGNITKAQMDEAIAALPTLEFNSGSTNIKAPHFIFYVRSQLEEMFGADVVEAGGLKVTTSLDWELQEKAQTIVSEEIEKVESLNITNGAATAMDPKTGEILAMVGSADYFNNDIDGQFNVVTDGLRQPGSSIKPVTYLAMLRRGYSPASMIMDVETVFQPNDRTEAYRPRNYDGTFRGPVSLRNALGSSLNIPAVKGVAIVGVEEFLSLAYDMGFKTLEPTRANLQRFGYAITLGGGEVHLLDTVSAYSAFANGGLRVEPVSILKVEDMNGRTMFEHRAVTGKRVISEGEAFLINDMLSDNNARLMAFGANSLLNTGRPIAVKTGTTNEQKDNWTIGWSQNIMVGTWVGNSDNTSMRQVASGITGASPIWRRIINEALAQGYQAPAWVMPDDVVRAEVDAISGYPSHDGFASKFDYFLKNAQLTGPDPIHTKLKVCRDDESKLANESRVGVGDYNEKEFIVLREEDPVSTDGRNRWQEAINAWVAGQSDDRYKAPTEYCGNSNEVSVRFVRPENRRSYSQDKIDILIEAGSDEGVEKLEIKIIRKPTNTVILEETITGRRYETEKELSKGSYELQATAYSQQGKTATTRIEIGTGGADWQYSEATSSATPN